MFDVSHKPLELAAIPFADVDFAAPESLDI
jgi:hypothetical protein